MTARIALGFGMGIGVAAVISLAGALAMRVQRVRYEAALTELRDVRLAAAWAGSDFRRAVIDYTGFLISGSPEEAASRDSTVALAARTVERLRDGARTIEERAVWTEALEAIASWDGDSQASLDAARAGLEEEAMDIRHRRRTRRARGRRDGGTAQACRHRAASGSDRSARVQRNGDPRGADAAGVRSERVGGGRGGDGSHGRRGHPDGGAGGRASTHGCRNSSERRGDRQGRKARDRRRAESTVALAEKAQSIGEIVATVTDLAEQTNLRALNAAVEAARAGEHGRGFAVVAAEVKALADQSKRATAEVRRILRDMQKATGTAVMTTEQGTKQVSTTVRHVAEAGETIHALLEAIVEAAQATDQIAASAGQRAAGMAQIRQAMGNIQSATQQNLTATRQAERAARDLHGLGLDLLALVGGDQT